VNRSERRKVERNAKKLLQSPRFFHQLLRALRKDGLVGEEQNALVVFIVQVSRLLPRPLNLLVKGKSSAGKNFLVKRLLRLLPRHAFAEITSTSETAWNYLGSRLRHTVVYLQEHNEAAGNIHPLRQLISEEKLIRRVTGWSGGKRTTKKHVAYGPVASISTTTKQLQIDDETRNISISINETPEQTRKIVKSYVRESKGLNRMELMTWRTVHRLLEKRIGVEIIFPEWFDKVADRLFIDDLRVRRYYPAFIEACRTVSVVRSFQSKESSARITVDFADFAMTTLIFDQVFVGSLRLRKGVNESTRDLVARLSLQKKRPVSAKDVSHAPGVSMDRAYRMLRSAESAGVITRTNEPEKRNRKLFLAVPPPRFIPDPKRLFRKLHLKETVRIFHPITGEQIVYRSEK
jgi:hypothetical protein